jgi:hypothetical protein
MRLDNPTVSQGIAQRSTPGQDVPPAVAPSPLSANVEDRLEAILRESRQPMHIRDLRQALIERGVPLPGRGDEANIILRLSRAKERFARTGRGLYGLTEWGVESVPPVQRTKKVYRRRKAR